MMLNEEKKGTMNTRPIKFVTWLFVVSSIMLFAGWTSGYIVRQAAGNWVHFLLPHVMVYNTIFIVLSSVTFYWAFISAKKLQAGQQRVGLWLTMLLGIAFLCGQVYAWHLMSLQGVYLTGNPSGSFLIVITLFHCLHIIAGLVMLLRCLIGSYKRIPQAKMMLRMEITSIFWHFIDILWIYLYVFLLLNR